MNFKVLFTCPAIFNPIEFRATLRILIANGVDFISASNVPIVLDEDKPYKRFRVQQVLDDIDVNQLLSEIDGALFIAGKHEEVKDIWHHPKALEIVRKLNIQGKPLGGVCASVPVLRYACKGKQVSVYPMQDAVRLLKEQGALVSSCTISCDQNIATAENRAGVEMWAENFIDLLNKQPPRHKLTDIGFEAGLRLRKPIPELEDLKRKRAGVDGPEICPSCNKMTECRGGRIVCPFGCGDFTYDPNSKNIGAF